MRFTCNALPKALERWPEYSVVAQYRRNGGYSIWGEVRVSLKHTRIFSGRGKRCTRKLT